MTELQNEFSWSKSREDTFHRCPRQYFFQYYGSWGGWNHRADARTRSLYVLKQLKSRQMWAGEKVHACIRDVLTVLRSGRTPPDEEMSVEKTLKGMREDYRDSGEGSYWDEPKKFCALFEHEYDIELSDTRWKETVDHALDCIRTFYRSDIFRSLAGLPRDRWLDVESLASFQLDGVKIFVQLDLAHRQDDNIVIYDWKTGRSESAGAKVQLACYTLYAMDMWRVPPERVKAIEFNLAHNEVHEHRLATPDLDALRGQIAASARAMQELLDDPAANAAREERFAFAANEKTCHTCNFLRVCPRWTQGEAEM